MRKALGGLLATTLWGLLVLTWLLAALTARAGRLDEARVEVILRYRVSFAPGYFKPTALILDPKRELYCPSFRWLWGDGCESAQEPWCDPFDPGEVSRRWSVQPEKGHTYRAAGEYEVTFELVSGDRTLRASQRVIVRGETLGRNP